jgi:hypothetical protein
MLHLLVNKCKCRYFKLKEQIRRIYVNLTQSGISKFSCLFYLKAKGIPK